MIISMVQTSDLGANTKELLLTFKGKKIKGNWV